MKAISTICIVLLSLATAISQGSLAEQLGYAANARLLIIHADDLGIAHTENAASFHGLTAGSVNSGSIMAPCPWVAEVADWAREHPNTDLGIHLTLTNEWKQYKWGPVAPKGNVVGLLNDMGFLHSDCAGAAKYATPLEVEIELRAQIEQILKFGISPTHLDSHMGCLFQSPEYFDIYLRLGREYGIPVMVPNNPALLSKDQPMGKLITADDLIVDHLITAAPNNYDNGFSSYYTKVLQELNQGVSVLLIHCAYDNHEMQGVAVDHPDWGAAWRQADIDFFSSNECAELLKQEDIQLVTWRELGDRWKNRNKSKVLPDGVSSFKSFDDTNIAYTDEGDGDPIILLHGFISSGNSWNRAIIKKSLLEQGYRVIVPDLRGNGHSDKSLDPDRYKNDAEIKDMMAMADHLGLDSYDALGYSRGSIVLAKLLTRDTRIKKAVIGGMGLDFTNPQWDRRIMFAKAFGKKAPLNDITRGAVEYATSIGADNKVLSLLQHYQPVTSIAELATIKSKVMVIAGDEDTDNGDPAALQAKIPNSTLKIVVGDHNNTYKSEVFAIAVMAFLNVE